MKTINILLVALFTLFACDAYAAPKKAASKTKAKSSQTSAPLTLNSYLASRGMDSSLKAKAEYAKAHGIKNYKRTAAQNTALLAKLIAADQKTSVKAKAQVAHKPAPRSQVIPKAVAAIGKAEISRLQEALAALGHKIKQTGKFDKDTSAAYEKWRRGGFGRGKKGILTSVTLQKIEMQAGKKLVANTTKSKSFGGDIQTMLARTTHYNKDQNTFKYKEVKVKGQKKPKLVRYDSDPWTKLGKTFTNVPQFLATVNTVGTAATDPNIIPFGSAIMIPTSKGPEFYIAGDIGGAVTNRTAAKKAGRNAAEKNAIVVDCVRYKDPALFTNVHIAPYRGAIPFKDLSRAQKLAHFNISHVKTLFAPVLKTSKDSRKNNLIAAN